MRVLVVDDEPLARDALSSLLAARGDVTDCERAGDAIEAQHYLSVNEYDILLLDINLPEVSGLELLERMERRGILLPSTVLVTAHSDYALAAFSSHAVDYVLKPFSADRLNLAIDAASRRTQGERAIALLRSLPRLREMSNNSPDRIAIKSNGRLLLLKPDQILTVHAEGNYVLLKGETGTHLLREQISAMAQKLQPFGFIRIHRSVLVNSSCVEEVKTCSTGDYALRIKGGKQFKVTRNYKANLKTLAATWFGIEGFWQ
jgi:two-component system, LytTR family, response regulator